MSYAKSCVQSLMVAKAKEELEQEIVIKEEEKERYLAERAPPLNTSGLTLEQLQVNCSLKCLHSPISFTFILSNPVKVDKVYLTIFYVYNV